ncbi:MAG: TetR/AcrR family transcriptional regulator [Jatrophihabitans sp.]
MKTPVSRVTDKVSGVVAGTVSGAAGQVVHVAKTARDVTREVTRDVTRADGRSSRWTEHRAARREELIDAAVAAVTEFGTDVGMDQIAAAAHTSKPVIYRYFADKTELYRAVGDRVVARTIAALQAVRIEESDPRAVLHRTIDAYLELLEDNPLLFRFVTQNRLLAQPGPGESTPAQFSGTVSAALTESLGEQLRSCGLDPTGATPWGEAAVGFIRAAGLWWIDHPNEMTRPILTGYLTDLLWSGAASLFRADSRTGS